MPTVPVGAWLDRVGQLTGQLESLLDSTARVRRREVAAAERDLPTNEVVAELGQASLLADLARSQRPPPAGGWGQPLLDPVSGVPVGHLVAAQAPESARSVAPAPVELPEGSGLDLPPRSENAPGWSRVLDELAWFRAKLLEFHYLETKLAVLNRDSGKTYTSTCRALVDQLKENLIALHSNGAVTYVQSGIMLRALPHAAVVWVHHIENYLRVIVRDHTLRSDLDPKVNELVHALPHARMIHEQKAHPDMNTWFDCGVKPGVLPDRLKELLEAWERRSVGDEQAAEMEERLLRSFVYN